MKTALLMFVLFVWAIPGHSQQDTALLRRINEILKLTEKKDLEKVMDYTYPKLFTIVPREMLVSAMQQVYETDEFTIELDSVKLITLFPVFVIKDTSYVKIKHSMIMRMKFKEPLDTSDMESKDFMVSVLGQKYGEENVRFDAAANSLVMFATPDMVGIKDNTSKIWTFANLNKDNPAMLKMIFNKAVLDKLKEYN